MPIPSLGDDSSAATSAEGPHKYLLVDEHAMPLKIAVVGGGIGGLTAAIGLRRNGHHVDIYEQCSSSSQLGAAIHLAPNCNGVLRRWGIYAETFGANEMQHLHEFDQHGGVIRKVDLRGPNRMWQHPWLLCHRHNLHEHLTKLATGPDGGPGRPAALHFSNKVVHVDGQRGAIKLDDGTVVEADVVLGVDGVYSRTRSYVKKDAVLFPSGKAVFRFLIPRHVAASDPETAPWVEQKNALSLWYGDDRRIVMYPCNNNEVLNFVAIHPDSESHATKSDEWDKQGELDQLLKVFGDFNPTVKKLMSKIDPSTLKVWQLMDMEKLPTWCNGKLALVGDAAHPFTPHQGQGAGQAIEDAAAITVVLPRDTAPEDVPERLKLYEKIRYERAHMIQEYSRQAGKDWINGMPQIDMMAYTAYNFGHDELDYASDVFRRRKWAQNPNLSFRMPLGFGPAPPYTATATATSTPHPRPHPCQQKLQLQPTDTGTTDSRGQITFCTATIRFRTSRTFLQTLFPVPQFRFTSPATVCEASIRATKLDGPLPSLAGGQGGSSAARLGLYVHGVKYQTKQEGVSLQGTYVPVVFENYYPAVSDDGEEGGDQFAFAPLPRVFCDVTMDRDADTQSIHIAASWRDVKFAEFVLEGLQEKDEDVHVAAEAEGDRWKEKEEGDDDLLAYRFVPAAVGQPGRAEAGEYACVVRRRSGGSRHPEKGGGDGTRMPLVKRVEERSTQARSSSIRIDALDPERLPMLHHVTSVLAQMPVYEVIGAKVVEGLGMGDLMMGSGTRIE